MNKGRKIGDFGSKMQVFPHSYSSSTSSAPPNPKSQHKTHQNLEKQHFYEALKSSYEGKWKWRMRWEKRGSLTFEVNLNSKKKLNKVLFAFKVSPANGVLSWRVKRECFGLWFSFGSIKLSMRLFIFFIFTPHHFLSSPILLSSLTTHSSHPKH